MLTSGQINGGMIQPATINQTHIVPQSLTATEVLVPQSINNSLIVPQSLTATEVLAYGSLPSSRPPPVVVSTTFPSSSVSYSSNTYYNIGTFSVTVPYPNALYEQSIPYMSCHVIYTTDGSYNAIFYSVWLSGGQIAGISPGEGSWENQLIAPYFFQPGTVVSFTLQAMYSANVTIPANGYVWSIMWI